MLFALFSLVATHQVWGGDTAGEYAGPVKVRTLLKTDTDAAGRPIAYPTGTPAEVSGLLVEIPPGGETGWHRHPLPCLAYMLEGEIEVTLSDGRINVVKAGEAFAEVVDLDHNGRNLGKVPARLVLFVLGTQGQPFTLRRPAPGTIPSPATTVKSEPTTP